MIIYSHSIKKLKLNYLLRVFAIFSILSFISIGSCTAEQEYSLDGDWLFKLDQTDKGLSDKWFNTQHDLSSWEHVTIPHTWQVESGKEDYYGVAWYSRTVAGDLSWREKIIRLEFDAVYRDTMVWVNGKKIGDHIGSGWTPFAFSITEFWNHSGDNIITVRVDNQFSKKALPYLRSSDWAADGGIIRSVRLKILPRAYIESIMVQSIPNQDNSSAKLDARIKSITPIGDSRSYSLFVSVFNPLGNIQSSSQVAFDETTPGMLSANIAQVIQSPILWHFDQPRLYRMVVRLLAGGEIIHQRETRFGVRSIELKDGFIFLNGEAMRLMGVEWMPGSDPRYGMAESPRFMRDILADMKELNCIITRFHWQQDQSVFEFCDNNGMLVQEEVPSWGGKTMEGDFSGIQSMHTREMIEPHYNHPSIYAWGLCNEIGGQSKAAHKFISDGITLAREIDPYRPLTYASNSLQNNHGEDASKLLDFLEWNDYYESWYGGSVRDAESNLEKIAKAYPGKSLIVSEYGLCECDPKNPTSDERRIEILKTHTDVYRKSPLVAGAIFFDYNDYRTHIGDKGQGSFQQRVHGVVDLQGRRKPSWEALKRESSPIRSISISDPRTMDSKTSASVEILTRSLENDLPAYTLRGYLLTWVAYDSNDLPLGTGKKVLPDISPGTRHQVKIEWPKIDALSRIRVDVYRPTGYSVSGADWKTK